MDGLSHFENDLRLLIGQPSTLRPFVCEGSPLACKVFIAGVNPASPMTADFWDFWQPDVGFDKARWFEAYKADRAARPLKPGRTRRNPISNSRRVIEWVTSELRPIECLETNIYATATEELRDLEQQRRRTAPFDLLLATIRPEVLILHGKDAEHHIRAAKLSAKVIAVDHFSRGWSEHRARELGRHVRSLLRSNCR